jgi:hypothetical protein
VDGGLAADTFDQLTTFWTDSEPDLRKRITAACHQIDVELQTNPLNVGESRTGNKRIAFFSPLAVTFHVDPGTDTVIVSNLRLYQKRPK